VRLTVELSLIEGMLPASSDLGHNKRYGQSEGHRYGILVDYIDEYLRTGEATKLKCVGMFVKTMKGRAPRENDTKKIMP
jgi:hypothetical protein